MNSLYETFALTGVAVATIAMGIWVVYHVGRMFAHRRKDRKR